MVRPELTLDSTLLSDAIISKELDTLNELTGHINNKIHEKSSNQKQVLLKLLLRYYNNYTTYHKVRFSIHCPYFRPDFFSEIGCRRRVRQMRLTMSSKVSTGCTRVLMDAIEK